jgi:uncharacterized radical SAM superfamily Fe-S cluster-containing enzyme
MNRALCESCERLVPAEPTERDGRIMLVKDCPSCGHTETLISGSAERYSAKRGLDSGFDHKGCGLNCLECEHRKKPTFVFVDLTNRCNMNCPICINNTPSMGFLFEPPLEYFGKIFDELATYEETPALQMFGGEPTMREDMFEIIAMAQARGLPVRVVTNGVKLADMDYCRRLVETRSTILIAYDGANPETYEVLRARSAALDLKLQALDNIAAIGGAKVALMTCMASGFNDKEIPQLLQFCHDRRSFIRGVYFMPLAHTWDSDNFDLDPPRITGEDIEAAVAACYPEDGATFAPAGAFCEIPTLMDLLSVKPPPFRGAHPNCESMYVLVSDGERYVPLSHYLKGTMQDLMQGLYRVEDRLEKRKNGRLARALSKVGLGKAYHDARAVQAGPSGPRLPRPGPRQALAHPGAGDRIPLPPALAAPHAAAYAAGRGASVDRSPLRGPLDPGDRPPGALPQRVCLLGPGDRPGADDPRLCVEPAQESRPAAHSRTLLARRADGRRRGGVT